MSAAAKTHQDIVDAIESLTPEYSALYKAARADLDARRDELRRQCGDIGHVFSRNRQLYGSYPVRDCVFCGMVEPRVEG